MMDPQVLRDVARDLDHVTLSKLAEQNGEIRKLWYDHQDTMDRVGELEFENIEAKDKDLDLESRMDQLEEENIEARSRMARVEWLEASVEKLQQENRDQKVEYLSFVREMKDAYRLLAAKLEEILYPPWNHEP
jgi:hypothetical protein